MKSWMNELCEWFDDKLLTTTFMIGIPLMLIGAPLLWLYTHDWSPNNLARIKAQVIAGAVIYLFLIRSSWEKFFYYCGLLAIGVLVGAA